MSVPEKALSVPALSKRELEVVLTWLTSVSKREVGKLLGVSEDTVRTHIARVRGKYMSVGRPASTNSDLMLRLMQDGFFDHRNA